MHKEKIEAAAKALWESDSHGLLERTGHQTDYESTPEIIKIGLRRKVRIVLEAMGIKKDNS